MVSPQQLEGVARERLRDWEREIVHRQVLAAVPRKPARWRRWTGSTMVWVGTLLMRLGERMARRERQESVSVAG